MQNESRKEKADFKMSLQFQTLAVRSRDLGVGEVLSEANDLDFVH